MKNLIKITLITLLCIIMVTFSACSNSKPEKATDKNNNTQATTSDTSTEEAVVDDGLTMPQSVIFDKGGVTVTATEYDGNSNISNFYLTIENNSSSKARVYSCFVEINDLITDSFNLVGNSDLLFYEELDPGEKCDTRMYITAKDKKIMSIDTVKDIEFEIIAAFYDESKGYYSNTEHSDRITLSTSATDYNQIVDDSGDVLYNNNGIKLVNKGFIENKFVIYCENNSDNKMSVYSFDILINGTQANGSIGCYFLPGTKGFMPVKLNEEYYKSPSDVTEIEIKFTMKIDDMELVDEPTIKITF